MRSLAATRSLSILALSAVVLVATACDDDPTTPSTPSPLVGLQQVNATDSTGQVVPGAPPGSTGPGTIRGEVLGPPTAGVDSLLNAPRLVGATVRMYPMTGGSFASPRLGAMVAEVLTVARGRFVLPGQAGGNYIITITPPANSSQKGVWVGTFIYSGSFNRSWWIVLPRR